RLIFDLRVQFYIRFYTKPGESLWVTGNIDELGNDDLAKAMLLVYLDSQLCYGSMEVNLANVVHIHYSYLLKTADGDVIQDGCKDRIVDISKTGLEELQVIDTWNSPGEYENVFFTDAFSKVLLKENETRIKSKSPKSF